MDLDKKIESIDDIFTPFTDPARGEARIGEYGYFAQNLEDFSDLSICHHGTLELIAKHPSNPFLYRIKESGATYKYFLPSVCVQFPGPKFRPFNLHEFLVKFPIGTTITFRLKQRNSSYTLTFGGYAEKDGTFEENVCIGCAWYSFKELAEEYEYKGATGEWVAFGVKEL